MVTLIQYLYIIRFTPWWQPKTYESNIYQLILPLNTWLLPKKKGKKRDETVRKPYFIVVLVNRIITSRNPYTKHALPNVSYATKSRCVNQINVSFFNEPWFMNIFEKTMETEIELGNTTIFIKNSIDKISISSFW